MKTVVANGLTKQDERNLGLIEDYLEQFREIRAEMKRSHAEIQRLKAISQRTMKETWEVLHRVEASL